MRTTLTAASWVIAGGRPDGAGDPLNVPMTPASNFLHGLERVYSREQGTPGWEALEELVGELESGTAVAFSSGMAGVAAVLDSLPVGAEVAIPDDCYQGVAGIVARGEQQRRWTVRTIATTDTDGWIAAVAQVDLAWLESPSNPLLEIADVPAICSAPRRAGCLVTVDNTFATPLNQRPLEHGADLVVHSATKFIGGHSDLLAGVVVADSDDLADDLREARALGGATPGTLETFLAVRGLRTLTLRLAAGQHTAGILAKRLEDHADVTRVRYPGLPSHPGHALAGRILDGFGSMISFEVTGGGARSEALCERLALIRHATSLGAVESTIERRAGHAGQEHLPPSLLRFSVGCEDVEDLWADLSQALSGSGAPTDGDSVSSGGTAGDRHPDR